jgi:hypothetical protein
MFNQSNISQLLSGGYGLYGKMCMSGTGSLLFVLPPSPPYSGVSQITDRLYISSTNQNFSLYNDVRLPLNRRILYSNPSYSYGTTTDIYYPNQVQIICYSPNSPSQTITLTTPFYETYVIQLIADQPIIKLPYITEQFLGLTIRFILQTGDGVTRSVNYSVPTPSLGNGFYTTRNSGGTPVTSLNSYTTPLSFIAVPSMYADYQYLWYML